MLAKKVGFEVIYLSGAALSSSLGLPDIGIMTMEELVNRTRQIVSITNLPLIVDGDTGYGEVFNVIRLVNEIEAAGAAAIQIEDQELPKKCGHLNGKKLISKKEMVTKVKAASEASSNLKIIARTDAVQSEGIQSAINRAKDLIVNNDKKSKAKFEKLHSFSVAINFFQLIMCILLLLNLLFFKFSF